MRGRKETVPMQQPAQHMPARRRWPGMLAVQAGLVAASALLLVMPRAEGPFLVVPLLPDGSGHALSWVAQTGGRLVGPARIPGALVVTGDRAALTTAALRHGALITHAPLWACGDPAQRR